MTRIYYTFSDEEHERFKWNLCRLLIWTWRKMHCPGLDSCAAVKFDDMSIRQSQLMMWVLPSSKKQACIVSQYGPLLATPIDACVWWSLPSDHFSYVSWIQLFTHLQYLIWLHQQQHRIHCFFFFFLFFSSSKVRNWLPSNFFSGIMVALVSGLHWLLPFGAWLFVRSIDTQS